MYLPHRMLWYQDDRISLLPPESRVLLLLLFVVVVLFWCLYFNRNSARSFISPYRVVGPAGGRAYVFCNHRSEMDCRPCLTVPIALPTTSYVYCSCCASFSFSAFLFPSSRFIWPLFRCYPPLWFIFIFLGKYLDLSLEPTPPAKDLKVFYFVNSRLIGDDQDGERSSGTFFCSLTEILPPLVARQLYIRGLYLLLLPPARK